RATDRRPHELQLAPERGADRLGVRRCGRGGHPEAGRAAERLEGVADEEVVRPEVVAPHAHAVHFVDHDQPDADLAERRDARLLAEPLRCRAEETRLPRRARGPARCVPPPPAAPARSRPPPSSGAIEDFTNVAPPATCSGSLSTWSFI